MTDMPTDATVEATDHAQLRAQEIDDLCRCFVKIAREMADGYRKLTSPQAAPFIEASEYVADRIDALRQEAAREK